MVNLCIDSGNTRLKAAIFQENILVEQFIINNLNDFETLLVQYPAIEYIGVCDVSNKLEILTDFFQAKEKKIFNINAGVTFPFSIRYETPQTLGPDRLCAVAGAFSYSGKKPVFVINAGTCITYDFLHPLNGYQGGAISPGLHMRLKSMHEFTQKLPLVELNWPQHIEGASTTAALLSGACWGLIDEIEGRISRYKEKYGDVEVFISGGDALLLAEHIKSNIFASPSLVLEGINKILIYNVTNA